MQTSPGIAPVAEEAKKGLSESMLPSSDGWDTADTVTSIPNDDTTTLVRDEPKPVAETTAEPPPVKEKEKEKVVTSVLAATPLAPAVSMGPKPTAANALAAAAAAPAATATATVARDEVMTLVRSAVDQAVAPLQTRIRELEARVERAEKNSVARVPAAASATSASSRLASIPVTMSASDPPPAVSTIPRSSVPATGLGIVVVAPGPRPAVDLEAIAKQPVGDIDYNPGGSRRLVGRLVVALMILAVVAFAVMAILSNSGPR